MQPTLYTPRLILRPFTLADAPRAQELAGDARVAGMTFVIPHPYPEGAAEQWIASLDPAAAKGTEYHFAVTLAGTRTPGRELDPTDTGHLIGAAAIGHTGDHATAILGYWIGVPYWNKGFATEAAHAVVDFAFQRRGYLRIIAEHFTENPAAGRVLQKLGMTPGERTWRDFLVRGRTLETICYTLTRDAWSRRRIIHRWKPATAAPLAHPALAS
jgi:RimJ/RimL family protein N-acetyltransferase